jgi:hypothetical protein
MTSLLPNQLLALSRLASNGAKALALSAGLDAQQFHRVFSDRARMPDEMEAALSKELAFATEGFLDYSVQASNCRQLDDIERLQKLGFKWQPVCFIASAREVAGGSPLQRYCITTVEIQGSLRVWVLRMAAIKFGDFFGKYEPGSIPTIVVPTKEIAFLNDVKVIYESTADQEKLKQAIEKASNNDLTALMEEVQTWIASGIAGSKKSEVRQRPTVVAKIADEQSRFHDWDKPTRKLAMTHEFYPISVKFTSVDGVGMLADGTPVFVDVVTLKRGQRKQVSSKVRKHCQHVVAFQRTGTDTDPKFEMVFDGPMSVVEKAIDQMYERRDGRVKGADKPSKERGPDHPADVVLETFLIASQIMNTLECSQQLKLKPRS